MAQATASFDDYSGGLGQVVGTLVLGILLLCMLLFVVSYTFGSKDTVRTSSQLISEHCGPHSYFAQASDGHGTFFEFCKMDTGQIGIRKYVNNKLVEVKILEGDFSFLDLIDFIESNGARLISYVGGIIPQK